MISTDLHEAYIAVSVVAFLFAVVYLADWRKQRQRQVPREQRGFEVKR